MSPHDLTRLAVNATPSGLPPTSRGGQAICLRKRLSHTAVDHLIRAAFSLTLARTIGFYSLVFARFGYDVIAIEPSSKQAPLEATLCMHPILASRVTIVPTAVGISTTSGSCMWRSFRPGDGNGELDCTPNATCVDTREGKPCSPQVDKKNRTIARQCYCETVSSAPLDEVLAKHVPGERGTYNTIVAKLDLEGGECAALASGQSLFTRLKADFIQIEALRPDVWECMHKQAERHGYLIEPNRGHDNNTVLWRPGSAELT